MLTTLGKKNGGGGTVAVANGAVLEFGKNVEGFGAVETPDDPFKPLINNGNITGDSADRPITLTGYVKGVGTLDNVVITGTDAPGFSVATVYRGSVVYEGVLEMEIGGTGDFDRIIHSGTAALGGALEVSLISGFLPAADDSFTIIEGAALSGAFDNIQTPILPPELFWHTNADAVALTLSVCGREADIDMDCAFTLADFGGLAECLAGPGLSPNPQAPLTPDDCLAAFDLHDDGDVDLVDWSNLQTRFSGNLNPRGG